MKKMTDEERLRANAKYKNNTLRRVLNYMGMYYKPTLLFVAFCILISSVSGVISTIFLQRLIDECITPGITAGLGAVWSGIIKYILIMIGIYGVGVIASFTYTRILAKVTQGCLMHFRNDMFNKMQSLPIKYFDTHAHGDIMSTYTNDTDALRQFMGQSMPAIIQAALSVVSIYAMMLSYSVYLTLLVSVILALMLFITKAIGAKSSAYMVSQQRTLAKEEGFIEEMIKGQRVVKVFCHEEEGKRDFEKINNQLCSDSTRANSFALSLMPILGNIGNLMYVLLALAGGLMIVLDIPNLSLAGVAAMSLGIIVSFLNMSRQLAQTFGQMSNQIGMIAMALAGAKRIFELIDQESEPAGGDIVIVRCRIGSDGSITECSERTGTWAWKIPKDGGFEYRQLKGDIKLNHVDFGYTPEKQILRDITLHAKSGQKIAFVGATGAGKTTITNLINRFYDINSGEIIYDGINIMDIDKSQLRRSLGIVLQDVNLFTGTVMDNIRYGRLPATDEECIEAAKLAGAHDFIMRLPDGYDTMLTGNGSQLSQGQRQLLSIARAAVNNAPAMILDEATSSIDTRTEALVQAGMDNLMKGRTVFVIAHRLSTVRNSDMIIVLDHGQIIEQGTHDELIAKRGTYYQLYTGAFELE